jgi:hypothetical protein
MAPIPLAYAGRTARWRRAKPWVGGALVLALMLGAAWVQQWLLPELRYREKQRQRSRWERQWYASCAGHLQPIGTLKYSEDPTDAPAGGFADHYVLDYHVSPPLEQGFVSFGGAQWDATVCHFTGWSPVCYVPGMVNLFIHERTTKSGVTRLIVVGGRPWFEDGKLCFGWQQIAVRKGFCRDLNAGNVRLDMTGICKPGEIRIFAGQPDLVDASRFSIPFQARGRRGWIDGVFTSQPRPEYADSSTDFDWDCGVKFSVRRAESRPAGDASCEWP